MARSVNTRTYSNDNEDYHAFEVIWHWDSEGIPFRLSLNEWQWKHKDDEFTVEIKLIHEGVGNLIIVDEDDKVLFSLEEYQEKQIRYRLAYEKLASDHESDEAYDKKRDDEMTEVEV